MIRTMHHWTPDDHPLTAAQRAAYTHAHLPTFVDPTAAAHLARTTLILAVALCVLVILFVHAMVLSGREMASRRPAAPARRPSPAYRPRPYPRGRI